MRENIQKFFQSEIDHIMRTMQGRLCYEESNCNYLAWALSQAGDGHHLEIGTLHGGSAILVALVKRQYGYEGDVWCVDPLDGYYMGTPFEFPVDWESKVPVSPEILMANLEFFNVADRVHIVQARSDPLPAELPERFASAFIDGDHWGPAPLQDWRNVKPRVDGYVIFDNADLVKHPNVWAATLEAAADPEWETILTEGITAVFRRMA